MNDRQIQLLTPGAILAVEQKALIGFKGNGHSLISPSGASRWSKCVGSLIGLHEHRRTATDNPASIEGTTAHYLLEFALINRVCPTQITIETIGELDEATRLEVIGWCDNILSKEGQSDDVRAIAPVMRDQIIYLNFSFEMRDYIKKVYNEFMSFVQAGYRIYPEMRVSLKKYFGHSQCDGSGDGVMVKGDHLIIGDLKYGVAEEVFPEHNTQLSLYALGACSHIEDTTGTTINRITIAIAQPRVNSRVWDTWETTKPELLAFAAEMKIASIKALLAIGEPSSVTDEMHRPSEKSCKYCHRKTDCVSRKELALNTARDAFTKAGAVLVGETFIKRTPPNTDTIDSKELAWIMAQAPFIISFLKDCEKETFKRVRNGKDVGGRKLVRGRLSRSWKTSEEQLLKTLMSMGADYSELVEVKVKSPAKMDTANVPNDVRDLVKALQKQSFGEPVIALANDRREAVAVTNAAQAFADSNKCQ